MEVARDEVDRLTKYFMVPFGGVVSQKSNLLNFWILFTYRLLCEETNGLYSCSSGIMCHTATLEEELVRDSLG